MMVMAIVLCVLYALQCFIATCIDPSGAAFAGNTDNAFYAVAKMAAGPWLMIVCAVGVALAQACSPLLRSRIPSPSSCLPWPMAAACRSSWPR